MLGSRQTPEKMMSPGAAVGLPSERRGHPTPTLSPQEEQAGAGPKHPARSKDGFESMGLRFGVFLLVSEVK